MGGHAETAPESSISGLAALLMDQPETESEAAENVAKSEVADTQSDTDQGDESADETGTDDEPKDDESEDSETTKDQQPRKYKVTVKGEDGADVEQEVDDTELIKGYQRQADYTRKSQELAKRENEIATALKAKHDEYRDTFMQQAELARAAVLQLAGFKTPQEMLRLAQEDPAAAVAEEHRQRAIGQMLGQIDQQLNVTRKQQTEEMEKSRQAAQRAAWEKLSTDGITKEGLSKMYERSVKDHGVHPQSLEYIYDPAIVTLLRDGLAYRDLQSKKPEVTRKAKESPRMPSDKSPVSRDARNDKEITAKFKSGRARLGDLAALLSR